MASLARSAPGQLKNVSVDLGASTLHYDIRRVIGNGATSVVYEAVETEEPKLDLDHLLQSDEAGAAASSQQQQSRSGAGTPVPGSQRRQRTVALKVLHGPPAGGNDGGESLHGPNDCREARQLKEIQRRLTAAEAAASDAAAAAASAESSASMSHHSGILNFNRHFVVDGNHHIVTELARGGSIYDAMRSQATTRNGLQPAVAKRYVAHLLAALAALHEVGVVHRDVKASNMLLTDDQVKLGDFGAVHVAPVAADSSPLEAEKYDLPDMEAWVRPEVPAPESAPEGTVFWLAPEALQTGVKHPCLDVWAVGCTVVELLTGKPPFFDTRATKGSVLYTIATLKEDPLDQLQGLPRDAAAFASECLRIVPKDRPTAAALLRHPWLEEAIDSSTVHQRWPRPLTLPIQSRPSAARMTNDTPPPPASQPSPGPPDDSRDSPTTSNATFAQTDSLIIRNPPVAATGAAAQNAGAPQFDSRTQRLRSVLTVLTRSCNAARPLSLAEWLLGVHSLDKVSQLHHHDLESHRFTSAMSASIAAPIIPPHVAAETSAAKRKARESIAELISEFAAATTSWRSFRDAGSDSNGSSAHDRMATRDAAVDILVTLGQLAGTWKALVLDLLQRRLARGAAAPTGHVAGSAAAAAEDEAARTYEMQMLAGHHIEDAQHSFVLTWLLLDALTHTGFWTAALDLRVMFQNDVSFVGLRHDADPASPSPPRRAAETDSATFEGSIHSTTSLRSETDPSGSMLSPASGELDGADPLQQRYDEALAALRDIFIVTTAAIAVPSAAPYAMRLAGHAVSSGWALPALLAHTRFRMDVTAVLDQAIDLSRTQRQQLPLVDATAHVAMSRLEGELGAGAAPSSTVVDVDRDESLPPATTSASDAYTRRGSFSGSMGAVGGGVSGSAGHDPRSTEVKSLLAASITVAAHADLASLCFFQVRNARHPDRRSEREWTQLRQSFKCLAAVIACVPDPKQHFIFGAVELAAILELAAQRSDMGMKSLALLILLQLALADGEWALERFHMGPFLSGALDAGVPERLRHGLVAALVPLSERLTETVFAALEKDRRKTAPRLVEPPSAIGVLLQRHPSDAAETDSAIAAVLVLARRHKAFARCFAADRSFVRNLVAAVAHADRSGHALNRKRALELVRELFMYAEDLTLLVDSRDLCVSLVNIAQDKRSSRTLTAAACELLNAFANVAVF